MRVVNGIGIENNSNHCLYTVHARRLLKTLLPAGLENS